MTARILAPRILPRFGTPADALHAGPLLPVQRLADARPAGGPVSGAIPLVSHTSVRRARWGGLQGLERLAVAGLGERAGLVRLVATAAFRSELEALARTRPAAIAVLGGDGTARTALEVLTPLGIPVVPLPGGTLNRLSRLVYGQGSARAILKRVAAGGRAQPLAGARLGPHRFFVACGFGAAMGLHGVREALRRGAPGAALQAFRQAARGLFAPRVLVAEAGHLSGPARAPVQMAVVAVGPMAPAFGLPAPARPAPGQGGLELVAASAGGWWQLAGLVPHALAGSWPRVQGVARAACDEVRLVAHDGHGWGGPVPGLLDGEPTVLDGEAVILFDPACGLVMAA